MTLSEVSSIVPTCLADALHFQTKGLFMNMIKALWCRTFQTGLRIAIPFLPYRKPDRIPSVEALPEVLNREGIDSVLLITDRGIRGCGLTQGLENALKSAGIKVVVYDRTVPNPTSDNVEEARTLYISSGCKGLIGFGGGSSMDCAKGVAARIARPRKSLKKMAGILKVHHRTPTLVAIPTTAGTGSEVTVAAVITDSKTHHKYAITDFFLQPKYAVLDPELTRSLPKGLTSTTALDALTHAVEAYIGKSTTRDTRQDSRQAVRLIFENLDRAYNDGNDIEARRNLLHAAYLAGSAFTKSYVGYVHAVAHSLSGKYNLPHGYTNAILLPIVLEKYGKCVETQLAELSWEAGLVTPDMDDETRARVFIDAIRGMNERFGLPDYFKELRKEDITEMSVYADKEANPLYPVPVLWNHNELEDIYLSVMESGRCRKKNSRVVC